MREGDKLTGGCGAGRGMAAAASRPRGVLGAAQRLGISPSCCASLILPLIPQQSIGVRPARFCLSCTLNDEDFGGVIKASLRRLCLKAMMQSCKEFAESFEANLSWAVEVLRLKAQTFACAADIVV